MRVNLNTQNYGYTNSQKANKTAFGATLKEGTLVKVAKDTIEHIGGDEVKNMLAGFEAAASKIGALKADGKDFTIECALKASKTCNIAGHSSVELTPSVSSTLESGEVVKKFGDSIFKHDIGPGKRLGAEFVRISNELADKISNSKTFIETKAKAIEEAINKGTEAASQSHGSTNYL